MLTPDQIKALRDREGLTAPLPSSAPRVNTDKVVADFDAAVGYKPPSQDVEIKPTGVGPIDLTKPIIKGVANLAGDFAERGKNIMSEVEAAKQEVNKMAPEKGLKRVGASALGALKVAGRATGQIAGGVGDIFLEAMKAATPDELEQKVSDKVAEIVGSDKVRPAVEAIHSFAQKHPEAAKDAETLIGVLTLGGGSVAEQPIKEGLEVGAKKVVGAAGTTISTLGDLASPRGLVRGFRDAIIRVKYGKNAEKALASLEKAYSEIPLPKNVLRGEAETGKSFAKFMSEKPYIKMGTQNGKFDTWAAAQQLRQEAQTEAKAVSDLLADRVETVSINKIRQAAKNNISKSFSGQEREAALRYVDNEFDALERQLGDKIIDGADGPMLKVADANKIKQDFWDRSPFNPTASRQDRLASSIDYKLGHSTKQAIEDALPDIDLKGLNSELGDYYHTIEVLESLHGGAAPGGRLGVGFARVAGTVAGSPGGIVGSLAGYMTADQIAKIMMDANVGQAFKRYAVQQLYEARPSVAKQVAEIVAKEQGEQAARLMLPADVSIQMGAPKGESFVKTVPAPKGEPGRVPKGQTGPKGESGGQFFGTYKSTPK